MSESWNWPGARWWRVDLHAHTPASYDFADRFNLGEDRWQKWLESVQDAGIHAVAVTDHNTAAGITPIQQAAATMQDSPTIFPGVELTANDGSHLLLLVDPSSQETHVEHLLSTVGIDVDERGLSESRSSLSVEEILDACPNDSLILGAHVNSPGGLLTHSGQQRIAELQHSSLAAVEVNLNERVDETWLNGNKAEIGRVISQIWASDGHDFNSLGRPFTWIKMTRPDLEGLRLALRDGETSLKPTSSKVSDDPNNRQAQMAIERISVHDAKLIGRGHPTNVCLNPWFNAIIGGRGTGKSTLVDFCRKVLRRDEELDSTVQDEEGSLRYQFSQRMRVPGSRLDQGLLTDNTRLELVYRKDGERFLLAWSEDGSAQSISRIDGGTYQPEGGDISERFPVRIYSQKQLFALAQDPNALLRVIDDAEQVRSAESKRRIAQHTSQYLSLCAEARASSALVRELPTLKAELRDVQQKLEVLEQKGHASVLNTYRARTQTDNTWKAILDAAAEGLDSVLESVNELSVADFETGLEKNDDEPRAALGRSHYSISRTVKDLKLILDAEIKGAKLQIERSMAGGDASIWREAVKASEVEYQRTSNRLEQEGISNLTEYGALLDRIANLQVEIEGLDREMEKARSLEAEASEALFQYREACRQLSQKRKDFASQAFSDTLRVQVRELAGHEYLADDLTEILGIERFEEDRKVIADSIRPEDANQWDWKKFDAVVGRVRKYVSGENESWNFRYTRFGPALKKVPPERIDRLALYMPGDEIGVEFRDQRTGSSWRPLTQGSPGQQTAALLTFILSFGTEPIVLDQPEDDLDSTLIYELLVTRFRETKLRRQMIVVTHNPNIVVHGDAELVVSLDVRTGKTVIAQQGGLQETAVRNEICRVMEGGREAFETRYRRIIPPDRPGA